VLLKGLKLSVDSLGECVAILGKSSFTGIGSTAVSTERNNDRVINRKLFSYSSTRLLLDSTCYYIYARRQESQFKIFLCVTKVLPHATFAIMTVLFM
jgi:hypothetical protein